MVSFKMIGNKIAEARKKVNISQAQLAQQLFISSQAVGKWERGESMPDIVTFSRLAEIFGVDLNYFSDGLFPVSAETVPGESPEKQTTDSSSSLHHNVITGISEEILFFPLSALVLTL
jgi:transcriptional regulator with XRE-family HTH domain